MDDVFNYLPSRVSAVLMIAAAFLTGMDAKKAAQIYKRDRRKHASPNSAQTESVCAGALQVQLAGDAWYFGVLHQKRDDRRSDPSCRGRRHQTGRKADVCDSSAYPAVCRNDPVLVFLVRKETKSWNICMAEIFILMKT